MQALQPSFAATPRLAAKNAGPPSRELELKAWMLGGLDGDPQSHRRMLGAIRPLLLAFFRRRLRDNSADVEDLVQEVLVAVHERRASYDRSRPFTPWLFAVARHKLVDYLRRYRRTETLEGLDEILVAEGFHARSEARMDVDSLLRSLPEKQARTIRLTRLEELSVAEAAVRVGIGESDVKVSAHRGIKALAARVAGLAR